MRLIVMLLVFSALAGCATNDESGSASIYVKDAPTDEFAEIHVAFNEVRVHKTNNTNETGWLTIFSGDQDIDLLNASGNRAAFLGEADLAAGKYTQIRVIVTAAYGIDFDGNRTEFIVPSGTLKLNKPFTIDAGAETRIVLDFDLDRSLKQTGQTWRMTPVIGSTSVEIVADAESGADVHEEGEISEL